MVVVDSFLGFPAESRRPRGGGYFVGAMLYGYTYSRERKNEGNVQNDLRSVLGDPFSRFGGCTDRHKTSTHGKGRRGVCTRVAD